jgi:hypothetical protein
MAAGRRAWARRLRVNWDAGVVEKGAPGCCEPNGGGAERREPPERHRR